MAQPFALRPSIDGLAAADGPLFQPPTAKEVLGEWFIVLSSLPYWQDKRNVKITYSVLAENDTGIQSVQDDVRFQTLTSNKSKNVRGVNTPSQSGRQGVWDWRGSGLVRVVSNHWEVLAHGSFEGRDGIDWILIYSGKTFFAPAAVHVYSRAKRALATDVRRRLEDALVGRQDMRGLVETMFEAEQN